MLHYFNFFFIGYIICGLIFGSFTYAKLLARSQRGYPILAYDSKKLDVICAISVGALTTVMGYFGIVMVLDGMGQDDYGFMWTTRETDQHEVMRLLMGEDKYGRSSAGKRRFIYNAY